VDISSTIPLVKQVVHTSGGPSRLIAAHEASPRDISDNTRLGREMG
jgi:hypothetical protein